MDLQTVEGKKSLTQTSCDPAMVLEDEKADCNPNAFDSDLDFIIPDQESQW
jgi:hypothetical protein